MNAPITYKSAADNPTAFLRNRAAFFRAEADKHAEQIAALKEQASLLTASEVGMIAGVVERYSEAVAKAQALHNAANMIENGYDYPVESPSEPNPATAKAVKNLLQHLGSTPVGLSDDACLQRYESAALLVKQGHAPSVGAVLCDWAPSHLSRFADLAEAAEDARYQ